MASLVSLPPLTFQAQQALRNAQEEAIRRSLPQVDTEHLLLGLLLVGKGKVALVLVEQGVRVDTVREAEF